MPIHQPKAYWADQIKLAPTGVTRNTPTMENAWHLKGHLFLDGRAKTCEEQIETVITSPVEMDQPMAELPTKLAGIAGYPALFASAYGDGAITRERILGAIAAFSQTIVSGETKLDRFVRGDYAALNDWELQGLHLFRTKARCINCPHLTDLQYHNLGYAGKATEPSPTWDKGRYDATGRDEDIGKFRTLGLRNVANTFPYLHNGAISTLRDVIEAKDRGMPNANSYIRLGILGPLLKPLGLTEDEKDAIEAFLRALSSEPMLRDGL